MPKSVALKLVTLALGTTITPCLSAEDFTSLLTAGNKCYQAKEYLKARDCYGRAFNLANKRRDQSRRAIALIGLGEAAHALKNLSEAEICLRDALQTRTKLLGADNRETVEVANRLATVLGERQALVRRNIGIPVKSDVVLDPNIDFFMVRVVNGKLNGTVKNLSDSKYRFVNLTFSGKESFGSFESGKEGLASLSGLYPGESRTFSIDMNLGNNPHFELIKFEARIEKPEP